MAPTFPPDRGGLARAAARLASGLAAHVPVEVLTPSADLLPGNVAVSREGDLTVVRFGAGKREATHRTWFELLGARGPYRLVHGVYLSETGFLAAYAARYLNIACLVAARGNDLDRDVFRPEKQAGILHALSHADAVVGVSRDLCRVARSLGATGEVVWIPNGVDAERFRPVAPVEVEGSPVVGFFGEARLKKGLPTLLEAFRVLRGRFPAARLMLVGGVRGEDRGLLEVFLAQHPEVATGVWDVGSVAPEDLPGYYAAADVLWHPSYQDGLPNAVLEGLACGRVTVGTRVGGIPDVLDEGVFPGVLVGVRDAEALVEATVGVLGRREALEGKARGFVMERFSPEAEVRGYLELYERLRRP